MAMELAVKTSSRRYTISEYVQQELTALEKHEYRDGRILLMAGGKPDHSLIITNVLVALGNALKGKPCRVYDSNLRIRIQRKVVYTYPDASVICGPREMDPADPTGQTVLNPRVIVEVLSPSTEAHDRGEKFDDYRSIPSLDEYVLVSQTSPRIEIFLRQPDNSWRFTWASGLESSARLSSLDITLPLAEAYAGIEWPPDDADQAPAATS